MSKKQKVEIIYYLKLGDKYLSSYDHMKMSFNDSEFNAFVFENNPYARGFENIGYVKEMLRKMGLELTIVEKKLVTTYKEVDSILALKQLDCEVDHSTDKYGLYIDDNNHGENNV